MDGKGSGRRGRPRVQTESAKKRKRKEFDQKYRRKNKLVTVSEEAADAIRRIGEERGMTDKDVVTLLVST